MKTLILCVTALLFLLTSSSSFSAEGKNPIANDCSAGNAFDSFQCFQRKLANKERELQKVLAICSTSIHTIWGKDADKELRSKLNKTQENWLKYRDGHCERGYYSKASVHPPSLSMEIAACKLELTQKRIQELKKTFLD